jgi:transcriptional regulator with XRE-family HTH domain
MAPAAHPAKGWLAVRRISQRQVAEALGITEGHVSRVLNGHHGSSAHFRSELCRLLKLPESRLFLPEDRSRGVTTPRNRRDAGVEAVAGEGARHA